MLTKAERQTMCSRTERTSTRFASKGCRKSSRHSTQTTTEEDAKFADEAVYTTFLNYRSKIILVLCFLRHWRVKYECACCAQMPKNARCEMRDRCTSMGLCCEQAIRLAAAWARPRWAPLRADGKIQSRSMQCAHASMDPMAGGRPRQRSVSHYGGNTCTEVQSSSTKRFRPQFGQTWPGNAKFGPDSEPTKFGQELTGNRPNWPRLRRTRARFGQTLGPPPQAAQI